MNNFDLNPLLVKSLAEMGIEKPTPIQEQALPILLGEATDFLGLAATGTGKTVAFALPLLNRLDPELRAVQGLILCPTRELAMQVAGQIDLLGKHLGIRALAIYGGAPYGDQIRGLKSGARIVVGTPGRVVDHMEKGTLDLSNLQTLILDEADEMISMGFKEDLETILLASPRESCNTWLFSATMGREVRKVADSHLRDPQKVEINRTEIVPEAIDQVYYRVHEGDKPEIICKLIDAAEDFYGIIFCQTKALVVDLTQYLNSRGFGVDCLHGDMDQTARDRTMKIFRERKVRILVCTDVASRGLDVKDITHVINYSLPRELDNYVHRIGRTARSGKAGIAMSLVTPSHRGLVTRIEQVTRSRMREGKLPTRREIGAKKIAVALEKFRAETFYERPLEIMSDEWKAALAEMSREEIAARFLALNFPEVFGERKDEPVESPLAATPRPERRRENSAPIELIAPASAAAPSSSEPPRPNRAARRAALQRNPWQPPKRADEESAQLTGVIIQAATQEIHQERQERRQEFCKERKPERSVKPATPRFEKRAKPRLGDGRKPHPFRREKKGGFKFAHPKGR